MYSIVNTLTSPSLNGSNALTTLTGDNDFLLVMSFGDPIGLPLFTAKVFFSKTAGDNAGEPGALPDEWIRGKD